MTSRLIAGFVTLVGGAQMSEKSLKSKALMGSAWTLGAFGASRGLRLGSHLILAWLLTPAIFGLMALVKVFMQGLEMFSDVGIGPSIIQNKRGNDPIFLNTAWTIQIIRGFSLWIITCLLTYPFAWWYAQNDPAAWQLTALLPVAAFTTVIAGFNSTSLFTLNKKMKFGRITIIFLGTQVVSLAVMIGWALVHPTVWAMVAGGLAGALFKMIASHFLVPGGRVRLQWDQESSRELFTFGKWIFLSTAFTFLALNLDKLVLGKLLTLSELGLYGIALVFAKAALDVANRLGSSVMFPVYAEFQDQPDKLMSVALRAREVVLWVGTAVCICFAVGAPLFFETLWDPRYHRAGVLAQWIAIYMWTRILLDTMGRIPLALGNSRALFFSNMIQSAGIMAALAGYLLVGLPGFILGLAVGPVASHLFLTLHIPSRQGEMLRQSARFTSMAGLTAFALVGFTLWLRDMATTWIWLVAVLLCALLPLLVAARVAYHKVWPDGRRKNTIIVVPERSETR
ncbi:MAG: polysaccharide biosynthesis protein [Desulfobulbaceae bacterium]|nr:MAG: polysaccharide biosynthesis protein [Desulfobulbaceae bacterium]